METLLEQNFVVAHGVCASCRLLRFTSGHGSRAVVNSEAVRRWSLNIFLHFYLQRPTDMSFSDPARLGNDVATHCVYFLVEIKRISLSTLHEDLILQH